jgi:thioesterase domain-containing protein
MDGIEPPLTRMQDVAADNVARMRRIQPQGPYFLAGQCFGGRVVYEMARQLEAAGERVGMLFMLDASSPFFNRQGQRRGERTTVLRPTSRWDFLTRYVLDRMKRHVNRFMRLKGPERRAFIREKFSAAKTILQTGDLFRGDRRQFARRAVYAANLKVGRNYVPGPFGGPTILCLTRDREVKGPRNYRLDWLTLVPQIGAPVYMGGRNSGDMQNPPYVYELADLVNRELEAAHAKENSVRIEEARAV